MGRRPSRRARFEHVAVAEVLVADGTRGGPLVFEQVPAPFRHRVEVLDVARPLRDL